MKAIFKSLGLYLVKKYLVAEVVDAVLDAVDDLADKTSTPFDNNLVKGLRSERDEIVARINSVL